MYWQEYPQLKSLVQKQPLGLISDFDGTLSEIVAESSIAELAPANQQLLDQLQRQLALVALVSGRGAQDLVQRVGLANLVYIGNHGLERWENTQVVYPSQVLAFRPKIEAVIAALPTEEGMFIEDKIVTLSIHYRLTVNPEKTEQIYAPILKKLAENHDLHFSQGRMVFEIRPPLALNKGTALAELVHEYQLGSLIFIGDDTTDADAMRTAHELQKAGICETITIGVESTEMPQVVRDHADVLATGVADVSAFLAWLALISAS